MDKAKKGLLSKLFETTLATMGLDEAKIKEAVTSLDEEVEKNKLLGKDGEPVDLVPADPKDKDKAVTKDEDKPVDEKEPKEPLAKDGKLVGITTDEVNKMIKDAISAYAKDSEEAKKGMDEALGFANKFGVNIACDSADGVYDAILTKSGIDFKDCSVDEKRGMVKMLNVNDNANSNGSGNKGRMYVVGDAMANAKTELDYLPAEFKTKLGVN